MKLELDFALQVIRESSGSHYAGAIGMIHAVMRADDSPFAKVRNVATILTALETVLAEADR